MLTSIAELRPKPSTRVLLVFSTECFATENVAHFEDHLRDHLGHVLLYLRSPKARNECSMLRENGGQREQTENDRENAEEAVISVHRPGAPTYIWLA